MKTNKREWIIACQSVKPYLKQAAEKVKPSAKEIYLSTNFHGQPKGLNRKLQELIHKAGDTRIFLCYGACAGSAAGLETEKAQIVLPKRIDCFHMISHDANKTGRACRYFVHRGLAKAERRESEQIKAMVKLYGEAQAREAYKTIFASIEEIVALDEDPATIREAHFLSHFLKIPVIYDLSESHFFESFLSLDNPEDFKIYDPGERIDFRDLISYE